MGEVIRKAFVLRLKPGALADYVYWHDNIWPELKAAIATEGIAEITLWNHEDMVFLHSEVRDAAAWDRLWASDIHKLWATERMDSLMFYRPDGVVDSQELSEIWHFAPGAGE
jgi:L-rhamnose mutarotase